MAKHESQKKRLENLRKLVKVLNVWHFVYAIVLMTFLPHLTKGMAIHEHVVVFFQLGSLCILIAPFHVKWIKFILGWYVKTGRTLESRTFIPLLLVGALIGASISYIILRIFKHDGNWESTLSISYEDVLMSLYINIILALFSGYGKSIAIYYQAGVNIMMKSEKQTPFWKFVIALLFLPVFGVLLATALIILYVWRIM